ncbi:hypothetical protein Moror_10808 [Moniliophthora roreri MCA 2997]|uniref:F-box domain-containing protein n=1 Tax=Moniliophthora roreri (strain MCA 2997) TaxID=1381753 RepID=V2WMB1_MONRO|nr:hypothetical protein Moror_10808 [Moniliophthora roreri MCA 2997]
MDCQSPIYNLPSEILSTILMFCCEENELSSPPNQPIVITLSAVCGNWREIVLATPALWSKLDIVAESPSVNNGFISYLTQMTQLFMQRSKHAPLTWSLTCFNNQPFLPIYNHLIENSERWSDISLFVDDTLLQDPASLSVSGHIPMLKRLELNGLYIPREWNIFAVAPALSVVDCVPANSYDIYLPWVQIRDLTLRYSHIPESLYILSQCPNLEQLKLEFTPYPSFLRKGRKTPLGSSSCWKRFSCGERRDQMQQFLLRSQCTITYLRLEVPELDDQQVVGLLTLLPSLVTLHLHDENKYNQRGENRRVITPFFLQQFIVKDSYFSDPSRFLPRLSNLTLVIHSEDLDAECLHNAVVSRWSPIAETDVCVLRSVTIRVVGDVDGGCLEKLSVLEKLEVPGRRITISVA